MESLSRSDLAAFRRDGFIKVRVFDPEDLQPVKDELTRVIDRRARRLQAKASIQDLHAEAPFETRMALLMAQDPTIHKGFDIDTIASQPLLDHLAHPKMLAVVRELLGEEISLNPIHHIRAKPPTLSEDEARDGFFNVPWHQDSGVTIADSDISPILTCWRPIGDATEEMGCMRLIPGAHTRGHLPHVAGPYGTAIDPAHLPDTEPVVMACEEGEVVIMNQFVPHHSTPNRSDRCRWSIDVRYHVTGKPSGRDWLPSVPLTSAAGDPTLPTAQEWAEMWRKAKASSENRGIVHRIAQ